MTGWHNGDTILQDQPRWRCAASRAPGPWYPERLCCDVHLIICGLVLTHRHIVPWSTIVINHFLSTTIKRHCWLYPYIYAILRLLYPYNPYISTLNQSLSTAGGLTGQCGWPGRPHATMWHGTPGTAFSSGRLRFTTTSTFSASMPRAMRSCGGWRVLGLRIKWC